MKVKLINIGRNKVNAEIEVKDAHELQCLLMTHNRGRVVDVVGTDNPNRYTVVTGLFFRAIGEIEIVQR